MKPVRKTDWKIADTLICLFALAMMLWLIKQTQENISYHWNWQAAFKYVISVDDDGILPGLLLEGLAASLRLLILAGALSLAIGVIIALALMSPLAAVAAGYVEILRNLPPLVFMFIFFYFITGGGFGDGLITSDSIVWRWLLGDPARSGNLITGALCLAMFEGAFFAVIIRAGILSIAQGQHEAARSLGLSRWRTFRLVILPQTWRNIAAPLVGQMILLIKDSAILSVISVPELTFSAQEASVSSRQIFEVWLIAAGFYFMLCWPLIRYAKKLEEKYPQ